MKKTLITCAVNIITFFNTIEICYRELKTRKKIEKLLKNKAISHPKETAAFLSRLGLEISALQDMIPKN
jgi:hypothetical protein